MKRSSYVKYFSLNGMIVEKIKSQSQEMALYINRYRKDINLSDEAFNHTLILPAAVLDVVIRTKYHHHLRLW